LETLAMGHKRSSSKSFRKLFFGCFAGLAIGSACGGNPELVSGTASVKGPAAAGEPCESTSDCKEGLLCGLNDVCVEACDDLTRNGCDTEACLPNGECSQGLGRVCSENQDCNAGLTCSARSRCAVPCDPDGESVCEVGETCRPTGTCSNDSEVVLDPPPSGAGGDSGAGGAGGCIDTEVDFEPEVPTVLLLIDRSGSMDTRDGFGSAVQDAVDAGSYTLGDCPSNNDWRWNVVRDVLMSPTKGIVKPLEDRVRFGLSLYSGFNGQILPPPSGPGDHPIVLDPNKLCPDLIEVPISLGNHQAMLDQFKCSDIADDTPTGESLVAAAATLRGFQETGPKIIVLATDGAPDNCVCPDWGTGQHVPAACNESGVQDAIKAEVVATAKQIHDQDGFTVHVINVSAPNDVSLQQHLAEVAAAGGGEVYPGFSPGALSSAFEEIIDGVRSCVIDLDGEIAAGKESSGTVTLDGDPLELDGPDGWQVNSPSQIELLGDACETIKSGQHDLEIKFPCGAFKPPVR
jgi:hypothetical protein